MTYEEWVEQVPACITEDALWNLQAYRLGLFVADIGWADVTKLFRDSRTIGLSDQLYRALGGISATIDTPNGSADTNHSVDAEDGFRPTTQEHKIARSHDD